ncbi:MAG: hypothetical protein KKF48_04950 [Nanoarchaeota archaeon]|nr:hypothetical protein [Nanoarchaeota archaeon]MBU1028365.1 hypothetical protein [Nanoarchaeota archaeon]
MKNFIVGTGFAISLGFITSCTEIQKNFQTTEIVTRKIAGEDRTIDYGESRKALDALGYKGIILNDRERIYFKADQWGDNKIEIYVGTEAPDKPLNDYRLLGSMKRDELEKRILNTFEDHKK